MVHTVRYIKIAKHRIVSGFAGPILYASHMLCTFYENTDRIYFNRFHRYFHKQHRFTSMNKLDQLRSCFFLLVKRHNLDKWIGDESLLSILKSQCDKYVIRTYGAPVLRRTAIQIIIIVTFIIFITT